MTSVKKNFFYSSILTTAGYVFPLITYPYVSRILGVEKIGLCNFIDSIINYFMLFSMMGITVTGIREIAKVKSNKIQLNRVFSDLFILNTITTLFAVIVLLICGVFVTKLRDQFTLVCYGAIKLFFNYLLIEWLFKGLEDFKYITIRSIITRVIYVISIFIFVHSIDDYRVYYLLLCSVTVINAIINCWYSQKFVSLSFKDLSLRPYIKPFIVLGINGFLVSMYTTFNVTYLGFVSSDTEVGYYTTATKLYAIILSLYTAFTGVMLPRMSSLLTEKKITEFIRLLKKSISILIACSIPLIIFIEFYAPQIVILIAGTGYEGAILPMRIVMPLVFIIGYEQILIIQTLMPLKEDSKVFRNSIIGAVLGVVLNIVIVPYYFAVGSALVWIITELTILLLSQRVVTKTIKVSFPYRRLFKAILAYVPMCAIFFIVTMLNSSVLGVIISFGILIVYFLSLHIFFFKDEVGHLLFNMFK